MSLPCALPMLNLVLEQDLEVLHEKTQKKYLHKKTLLQNLVDLQEKTLLKTVLGDFLEDLPNEGRAPAAATRGRAPAGSRTPCAAQAALAAALPTTVLPLGCWCVPIVEREVLSRTWPCTSTRTPPPSPTLRLAPWDGMVRTLGLGKSDVHPCMAEVCMEASLSPVATSIINRWSFTQKGHNTATLGWKRLGGWCVCVCACMHACVSVCVGG